MEKRDNTFRKIISSLYICKKSRQKKSGRLLLYAKTIEAEDLDIMYKI